MKLYFIILLLILILLYLYINTRIIKFDTLSGYYSDCEITEEQQIIMNKLNIEYNDMNWKYFIPCGYDDCEEKIIKFEYDQNPRYLFVIDGCDYIGSKISLWRLLESYYGNMATKYMPQSYILSKDMNTSEIKNNFFNMNQIKKGHMFVLKNYEQRQEGIKLVNNINDIINGYDNGYYLVQNYLYDPFIINKRKTNFRYYTLIICKNNIINGYIHKNGFVYYTPEDYDENSMDFKRHITTGYIDRKIYDINPLSLDDFRNYLDNIKYGLSKKWDTNVRNLMYHIIKASSVKICKNYNLSHHTRFQLFGSDIASTSKLEAYLMEINKGPDLSAKDERDKKLKLEVQSDVFNIINNNSNNFEKIF
jgi:hypothetical protein